MSFPILSSLFPNSSKKVLKSSFFCPFPLCRDLSVNLIFCRGYRKCLFFFLFLLPLPEGRGVLRLARRRGTPPPASREWMSLPSVVPLLPPSSLAPSRAASSLSVPQLTETLASLAELAAGDTPPPAPFRAAPRLPRALLVLLSRAAQAGEPRSSSISRRRPPLPAGLRRRFAAVPASPPPAKHSIAFPSSW